jgi:hypothetical protein
MGGVLIILAGLAYILICEPGLITNHLAHWLQGDDETTTIQQEDDG